MYYVQEIFETSYEYKQILIFFLKMQHGKQKLNDKLK